MNRRRTRRGAWRAIVAVVALYAVALQGFLGGLRPPTIGLDAICSPERSAPGDGERHDSCCLAAHRCAAEAASAPPPVAGARARPSSAPEPVRYGGAETPARPAALPGHLGARGPPDA